MPGIWFIDHNIAKLSNGPLKTEVDLKRPASGAHSVTYDGHAVALNHFLGVEAGYDTTSVSASDAYTRGNDLVVRYAATPGDVWPELYWRAVSIDSDKNESGEVEKCAVGIELILSAQTNSLQSRPATGISTDLNDASLLRHANNQFCAAQAHDSSNYALFLARFENHPISYVEMLHPSDFESVEVVARGNGGEISYSVLPENLEKGVIRRVRLRGLFLPRAGDEEFAKDLYESFVAASPPLTA